MKSIFNIFRTNQKSNDNFDIDKLLNDHKLDYSEIDFEKKDSDVLASFNKLNSKLNKSSNYLNNLKSFLPIFNYKAILKPVYTVVLTSIVIFSVIEFNKLNNEVEYAEITVDAGEKITLHITDNFTVWLNSGTTIKIPMELKRNSRIYLDGEAFFEIKKNGKKAPEIIASNIIFSTNQGAFNINSNFENNQLIANIKEGNIGIYNPVLPKATKLMLSANEKVTYTPIAEFIAIEKEDNINYLAWKTGILNFEKTNLNEVSEAISKFYGIPIQVNNPELEYEKFTAVFNNANIDEILEKIKTTFNCEISGDGSKLVIN